MFIDGWLMEDDWKMLLVPFTGVKDDRFTEREDTMWVLRCPQIVANDDGIRGQGQYAMNASGTSSCKDPLNLGIGGYSAGASWKLTTTRESQIRNPADLSAVGNIGAGPGMVCGRDIIGGNRGSEPPRRSLFPDRVPRVFHPRQVWGARSSTTARSRWLNLLLHLQQKVELAARHTHAQ